MLNKKKISEKNAIDEIISFDLSEKTITFYEQLCREAGKDLRKELPDVKIRQMLTCKWILFCGRN